MKPQLILIFCAIDLLCCSCRAYNEKDEITLNQAQGQGVIQAIEDYRMQKGSLPQDLNALVPDYLTELPQTIYQEPFSYYRESARQYYLCFEVTAEKNMGCCYSSRLTSWDCGFGD